MLYAQKGAELRATQCFDDSGYTTSLAVSMKPKLNYVEVPLNFVYTDDSFQVFAGPYLAFGVGGGGSYKVTIQSTDPDAAPVNGDYPGSQKVEYGDKQNDNANAFGGSLTAPQLMYTARRFDAGLNNGVSYHRGLRLAAKYFFASK